MSNQPQKMHPQTPPQPMQGPPKPQEPVKMALSQVAFEEHIRIFGGSDTVQAGPNFKLELWPNIGIRVERFQDGNSMAVTFVPFTQVKFFRFP